MKFYIPTSSLNLNNILQSECILPISHYAQRLSGYKEYEQIEELRSCKSIVLFKFPVKFDINDSGRYNFPVLIEFEDDTQTEDFCENERQKGVHICSHTLNLTPTNCRFYFFSKQAYDITLINTKDDKSIKYFNEYKIYPNLEKLALHPLPEIIDFPQTEVGVCKDGIIDKQKGVLYAYIVGRLYSVNHDLAAQLRLSQELYNILTNIISTPSSFSNFSSKLSALLEEYKKVDVIEKQNVEKFENYLKEEKEIFSLEGDTISFLKFFQKNNVFDCLCKSWICDFLPQTLHSHEDFSKLRAKIDERTNGAFAEHKKKMSLSALEALRELSIVGNTVQIANAPLVNAVIRYIIDGKQTPEHLCANRLGFYKGAMDIVVPMLKREMGENNWKGSKEQEYVNNLYTFIASPTFPFNVNSIDNIELKSIAAFILKGQRFGDCIIFCRMAEFENYLYVLSLWGCLCGYMEMNRDALSDILDIQTYSSVYEKLYGKSMGRIDESDVVEESTVGNISENTSSDKVLIEELKFILENTQIDEERIQPLLDEFKNKISFSQNIEECWNSAITAMLKNASKQRRCASVAWRIYEVSRDEKSLSELLENEKGDLKNRGKKIILHLFPNGVIKNQQNGKKNKDKKIEPLSLFGVDNDCVPHTAQNYKDVYENKPQATNFEPNDSELMSAHTKDPLFVFDRNCQTPLKELVPENIRDKFLEDLIWFQDEYAKGEESPYYAKASRENSSTVEAFLRYIRKKDYAGFLDIELISKYLHNTYGR